MKEAARKLGRSLSVRVRIADLYMGWVRQQGSRPPAFRLFWTKFTTTTNGEAVALPTEDAFEVASQGRASTPAYDVGSSTSSRPATTEAKREQRCMN